MERQSTWKLLLVVVVGCELSYWHGYFSGVGFACKTRPTIMVSGLTPSTSTKDTASPFTHSTVGPSLAPIP